MGSLRQDETRVSTEESLAAQQRYGQFLETVPDAMLVLGSRGEISLVNGHAESLFGRSRATLIGTPVDSLMPHFSSALERQVGATSGPSEADGNSPLELLAVRKDGTEFPVQVTTRLLQTAPEMRLSLALRAVRTPTREAVDAQLLASAVESIQDSFALFDKEDRLVLCNSGYRQLVGERLSGSVIGKPYPDLLDAWIDAVEFTSEAERAHFRADRLTRRGPRTATFDLKMRDGRRLRVIDRCTPEGGTVKTIWDLTDQIRLTEELREARVIADEANQAKSEFVSSMSHELRTPLNAILGFAQLLQRDRKEPLSERHQQRVEQILKGGEHLLHLIDDILNLSRIEAGAVSIAADTVSVLDVLGEVTATLTPMAARHGLSIELTRPAVAPMVSADHTRFVQILMNLGSNAIKYNQPGGNVMLSVSLPKPGYVRVTVRDTGIGIPTEKQNKVFQPFQRAGQETGPIEGTGIGLFITKRLAQLMKGDVGFTSVFGQGSAFWVDIPESKRTSDRPPAPVETGLEPHLGASAKLILYVEDNPANVTFMQDLLSGFENVELLTAGTAELGLELARSHRPDTIVMDINLPGMSGIDALRALLQNPDTRHIPVIALSAAATEHDKRRGIEAGFRGYLTKPVKVDEFVVTLQGVLGGVVSE